MEKKGQTGFQSGKDEHDKRRKYIIVFLLIAIVALVGYIYFAFFSSGCKGNPLFSELQLSAIKRTSADVNNFCAVETSQGSCAAKAYFVYTTAADVADTERAWTYSDSKVDPASGMKYWGTIENACVWK